MIMTRSFDHNYTVSDAMPHMVNKNRWNKGKLHRAGQNTLSLNKCGSGPLMAIRGNTLPDGTVTYSYIPVAQDPTDPATWRVPVVWT